MTKWSTKSVVSCGAKTGTRNPMVRHFALAIGLVLAVSFPSSAAAVVIESPKNEFTGSGTLKLGMNFFKDNFVKCTSSTIKGTTSAPPNAKATITSWSTEGCAIYRNNKNVGSATVKVTTFPAVEAVSLTKLYFGQFTAEATFQISGSTCKPKFTVLADNPAYTNGPTINKIESFSIDEFIDWTFPLPEVCEFAGGAEVSEATFSLANPQFEVVEPPPPSSFNLRNTNSAGSADISFAYGLATDIPIAGDWDNDGDQTIGVYRPSTRRFYLRNSNSAGAPNLEVEYGLLPATPVIGDWDGNGTETIGLYSSIEANPYVWALNNANDSSGADYYFTWGTKGDIPIVGDWDNDGDTTIGLYRPSNRTFYLRNTNSAGSADQEIVYGLLPATPVIGDWDGDAKSTETIGLYSSIEANPYVWALNNANDSSGADYYFTWGTKGDIPIVGDWDGDGDTTVGLFRP